jgi:hypothetical protein
MSSERRLADLNPADRPDRAPAVAPPARRLPQPRPQPTADADQPPAPPSQPHASVPAAAGKASKVMHSVPTDVLDRLKQAAARGGRSYTDIVVACIVDHRGDLARRDNHADAPLGALDRRHRQADRAAGRSAQLTLYLTAAERAELDRLAADLGMARSQLVTAALRRGLNSGP